MVDEERYDINSKVTKNDREVSNICDYPFEFYPFLCKISMKAYIQFKGTQTVCKQYSLRIENFEVTMRVGLSFVLEKDTGPVSEDL